MESDTDTNDYLELVINAIIIHEGWFPANPKTGYIGSRSWRNNNPGNLRSSKFQNGATGSYATFESVKVGRKALRWDLTQKIKGNTRTRLNGESTIEDLIKVYAPWKDNNNIEAYISSIEHNTKLSRETKLKDLLLKREEDKADDNPDPNTDGSLQCRI